jgi:RNAse (barnase) inhibitor barstar
MDILLRSEPPWIFQVTGELQEVEGRLRAFAERHALRLLIFDGRQCTTFEDLYRHYWDVVHPPQWFGENLDAIYDNMTDAHVLGERPALVAFLHANYLLMREASDACERLLSCFDHVGSFWAAPDGEPLEPMRPFHTVLHLLEAAPAQLHRYTPLPTN